MTPQSTHRFSISVCLRRQVTGRAQFKAGLTRSDAHLMEETLVAVRWRRYGKDRLYVSARDGVRVGLLDIVTGQTTLEQPHRAGALAAAIDAWRASNPESNSCAGTGDSGRATTTAALTDQNSLELPRPVEPTNVVEVAATAVRVDGAYQGASHSWAATTVGPGRSWTDLAERGAVDYTSTLGAGRGDSSLEGRRAYGNKSLGYPEQWVRSRVKVDLKTQPPSVMVRFRGHKFVFRASQRL